MKLEKLILSFFAILVGLIAAGVAFYFYQMTKVLPPQQTNVGSLQVTKGPTPTPGSGDFLTVDSPKNESVSDQKTISITGKTAASATVIISSEDDDQVIKPAANGNFSVTETIPDGTSLLQIKAVFADGTEKTVLQTITYSTASF